MTEEEMEGPISFWGYKEQESNLILPEHDDDDESLPVAWCTNQFDIQELYALPTLYLFVLYLSENKQRLLPHIT